MKQMPEGFRELVEDLDVCTTPESYSERVDEAIILLKEMAEALELYESGKALYPTMGSGGPAYLVLKKFREWK